MIPQKLPQSSVAASTILRMEEEEDILYHYSSFGPGFESERKQENSASKRDNHHHGLPKPRSYETTWTWDETLDGTLNDDDYGYEDDSLNLTVPSLMEKVEQLLSRETIRSLDQGLERWDETCETTTRSIIPNSHKTQKLEKGQVAQGSAPPPTTCKPRETTDPTTSPNKTETQVWWESFQQQYLGHDSLGQDPQHAQSQLDLLDPDLLLWWMATSTCHTDPDPVIYQPQLLQLQQDDEQDYALDASGEDKSVAAHSLAATTLSAAPHRGRWRQRLSLLQCWKPPATSLTK